MKKFILLGGLCPLLLCEPSAFDAGNLSINNPYGLTENEKVLLDNKKKVDTLSKDYTGVDFKTNKALEQIDGIQQLLENLSNKTYNLENKVYESEKNIVKNTDNIKTINEEIELLKADCLENKEGIIQLKKALEELIGIIENLNKTGNTQVQKQQLTSSEKLSKAISLYNDKKYQESAEIFEELSNIKHKPAQCNFYLAQINYNLKNYQSAIYYYKTSIDLYNKQNVQPSNMSVMLYNTGNSLKALNQYDKAEQFYNAILQQYPNSKEAKLIQEKKNGN